jgi:hypothetical protein
MCTFRYQKFWGIKQKWGMAGAKSGGGAGSPKATKAVGTPKKTTAAATMTPGGKKRGANGKAKENVAADVGGAGSDAGSVDANHGSDPVEEDGSEAETEFLEDGQGKAKKVKANVDED